MLKKKRVYNGGSHLIQASPQSKVLANLVLFRHRLLTVVPKLGFETDSSDYRRMGCANVAVTCGCEKQDLVCPRIEQFPLSQDFKWLLFSICN